MTTHSTPSVSQPIRTMTADQRIARASLMSALAARWIGPAIAVAAFLHAALFAFLVPLWQMPDEPSQVEYVLVIAKYAAPLEVVDPDIQRTIIADIDARDFYYWAGGNRPIGHDFRFEAVWPNAARQVGRQPAYHIPGALIIRPLMDVLPIAYTVYLLRLYSAVLFALTVLFAFLTTRLLLPRRPLIAIGVGSLLVMLPMPAYLGASVNSDNLANLVGAAAFLTLISAERRGYRWWTVPLILAIAALGFYTKRTTLILLPLALLAVIAAVFRLPKIARLAVLGSMGAAALAAIVGFATVPPLQEFGTRVANRYIANESLGTTFAAIAAKPFGGGNIVDSVVVVLVPFFQSLVGKFGWFTISLADPWYTVAVAVAVVCLAGFAMFLIRGSRGVDSPARRGVGWLLVGLFFSFMLVLVYTVLSAGDGYVPQGRYLLVAMTPLAIFFVLGAAEVVPARLRGLAAVLGVVSLAAFDLLSILSALLPAFYP